MAIVAERPHNKHGSSDFIRDGLKVNNISVCEEENVELITVELPGVVVQSMYKPSPQPFRLPALGQRNKPVTHTQRETTEIIQQCNMEEGIQPGSHLCINIGKGSSATLVPQHKVRYYIAFGTRC